ncbi:MAG: tetratricopeptide repeat protein [Turneriella sp.]|nr:tetratricopeptide repeat protein [Turneriella sp.]
MAKYWYLFLALPLWGINQVEDAEKEFYTALSLHSTGALHEAAAAYRRALANDPRLVAAAINLAIIHEKWGETEPAEQLYTQAARLAPNLFTARYNRGQFLQKHGRLAEARDEYLAALSLKPHDASLYVNLAALEITLFELTHDSRLLKAAAEKLKQAEMLKSQSGALFFNLARLAELQNAYGTARLHYLEAMRRYPNSSSEYRQCRVRAQRLAQLLR